MSGGRYLILRREGRLWGVPEDAVSHVERTTSGVTVATSLTVLGADEVLGVRGLTDPRAVGALAARFIHERYAGFAVLDGEPVILVDELDPPRSLLPNPALSGAGDTAGAHDAKPDPRRGG